MNKFAIIDERASIKVCRNVEKLGFEVIFQKPYKHVSKSCSSHPDISLFRLTKNKIIYAPETDEKFLQKLSDKGLILIPGQKKPLSTYPEEIRYNAAVIGRKLFHKLDFTDEIIISEAKKEGFEFINVKQGYTACSTSIINDKTIITSDVGINNAALLKGIDSLLISPQKNIQLEGVEWGFIGGSTGRITDSKLAISGNPKSLESYDRIFKFLIDRNVELISLSDDGVVDLGTIMFFTL